MFWLQSTDWWRCYGSSPPAVNIFFGIISIFYRIYIFSWTGTDRHPMLFWLRYCEIEETFQFDGNLFASVNFASTCSKYSHSICMIWCFSHHLVFLSPFGVSLIIWCFSHHLVFLLPFGVSLTIWCFSHHLVFLSPFGVSLTIWCFSHHLVFLLPRPMYRSEMTMLSSMPIKENH
jgi:hypothetical protein